MEDFRREIRDLKQLNQRAVALGRLLADLDQAAPSHSEGTDRSGAVTAIYDARGLPEEILVRARWEERLNPAGFGAAVVEACESALRERGAAWYRALERSGWQERVRRLDYGADGPGRFGPMGDGPGRFRGLDDHPGAADFGPGSVPAAFRPNGGGNRPWVMDILAEEVMGLFDTAMSAAERTLREPQEGTGVNPERTLKLTLTPGGQVSCQAGSRWVERQPGSALTEALSGVLATARRNLAAATSGGLDDRVAAQAAQLTQEVLADLRDGVRFAQ